MPAGLQDQEWTVERALALPDDGNRYEVLDGELFVTPSPTWGHQSAISALHPVLVPWREGGAPRAWTEVKSLLLAVEGVPAGRPARRADLAAARGPAALPAGARGVLRGVGRVDVRPSPLVD